MSLTLFLLSLLLFFTLAFTLTVSLYFYFEGAVYAYKVRQQKRKDDEKFDRFMIIGDSMR